MQHDLEAVEYSIFEKGYPKRIFHKHIIPPRIYYGPNRTIIGFLPSRVEYFKTLYSSFDESILYPNNGLKKKSITK